MDFKLNDEQEEFRKLAREFAARELAPIAEVCDKHPEKAAPVLQKVFEAGLMNLQLPESLGGLALSTWDASLIAEELARGCSGIYAAIEYSALAQLPIVLAGTPAQQKLFLEPMAERAILGGIAADILFGEKCLITAVKNGDEYILSGRCSRLLNAENAEWFVFDALDSTSHERLSLIVPAKAAGVTVTERLYSVGRKASCTASVELQQVACPAANVLAPMSRAEIREQVVLAARIFIAAGMVGVAQSAFDHAKRYAGERFTFGKPIAQHQGIAFMMADMAKDIEAARELTWQTAIMLDKGDSGEQSLSKSLAAIVFASEMAMRVTTDAVQVYGGYGYSKEYPVEKLMRDAKTYQCMIPAAHVMKAALGKQLLKV